MNNPLTHDIKEAKLPNSNIDVETNIKYTMSGDGTYAIASFCLNWETAIMATIKSRMIKDLRTSEPYSETFI